MLVVGPRDPLAFGCQQLGISSQVLGIGPPPTATESGASEGGGGELIPVTSAKLSAREE